MNASLVIGFARLVAVGLAVMATVVPVWLGPGAAAVNAAPGSTTGALGAQPTPDDEAAIRDVIMRANQEQVDAVATGDPTVMRDTATDRYYRELARIDEILRENGVSAIELLDLQWGPIIIRGNTAEATTFETWANTVRGERVVQRPERNIYDLVLVDGQWLIDGNEQPDLPPLPPGFAPSTLDPAVQPA